jgi:hypothetical protein
MGNFAEYHQYREVIDALSEIVNFELELLQLTEYKKTHPGKGIPEKKKSDIVKKARKGKDMFGKGKNFEKIADAAGKRYGDEEAGKRVAGAIFWKKAKGKHMTKEDVDDMIWIVEDDVEVILDHAIQTHDNKEVLSHKLRNWTYEILLDKMGHTRADGAMEQLFSDPKFLKMLDYPDMDARTLDTIIGNYLFTHPNLGSPKEKFPSRGSDVYVNPMTGGSLPGLMG